MTLATLLHMKETSYLRHKKIFFFVHIANLQNRRKSSHEIYYHVETTFAISFRKRYVNLRNYKNISRKIQAMQNPLKQISMEIINCCKWLMLSNTARPAFFLFRNICPSVVFFLGYSNNMSYHSLLIPYIYMLLSMLTFYTLL